MPLLRENPRKLLILMGHLIESKRSKSIVINTDIYGNQRTIGNLLEPLFPYGTCLCAVALIYLITGRLPRPVNPMLKFSTLAERMSAGRLPVADALRIAAACAEHLRQMHDQGRVHGALTPSAVTIGDAGVQIHPAAPALTPYTAPEILAGRPADERTDIFSFGAILYEMITGRRAFEGEDESVIMLSLTSASPQPSGSAALDQVISGCVAKSANARYQRMHRVQLELRLLSSTVRRGLPIAAASAATQVPAPAPTVAAPLPQPAMPPAVPASARFAPPAASAFAPVSSFAPAAPAPARPSASSLEMEALEARIGARLQQQDQALASVQHVANEVLAALRGGALAAAPAPPPVRSFGGINLESEASMGRMDRAFELLNDKVARIDLAVGNAIERLLKLEQQLDEFDTDAAALRDSVTRDVRNFERSLKAQSSAIESARTAMGQTDDLVERVVEALDSLQSMFMTSAEERAAS
jgi:eukaryotic-like serine/threonine-protein kinase